jgi:hypothetical protein
MAGKPQKQPMKAESATAPVDEPQCTETMSLHDNNGSITVTIPAVAVKFLGYSAGECRRVEVYDNGVFIPKEATDE